MSEQLGFDFFEIEPKQLELDGVRTKECKTCGVVKPETAEYFVRTLTNKRKDGGSTDFFHGSCKDCTNQSARDKARLHKIAPPMPDHCECCGSHKSKHKEGKLHLDHDWKTGEFRGWICCACNRGIGNLGDDIQGVLAALEYLKRHYEKD